MALLEMTTGVLTLEVTSVQPIDLADQGVRTLIDRLKVTHAVVPLAVLELVQQAGDLTKYDLTIQLMDGRAAWESTFNIQPDFTQEKFNIPAFWNLGELTPIREVRQSLEFLIHTFGVTRIEGNWAV